MEYIPVPLELASGTKQNVYVRKQVRYTSNDSSDSDSDDDLDRTLFVTNLPLDTTDDNIRDMCKALGDVVLDTFERQGQRHGLIWLVDDGAAERFLSKARKLKNKSILFEQYGPRGTQAYLARHNSKFPEEFELQEKVDEYMELFAEQEQQEQEEAERAAEEVDADGFRLVVNRNRKRLSDIQPQAAEPKRKKKSLEKNDFYRFQLRENRKQGMSDLLKRYQQDKEKVEELKRRRMFRPF